MRLRPPSVAAAAVIPVDIALIAASNIVTPPPSSSIRYTFIVFSGKPPRTSQTPSAIRSGSAQSARRRALAWPLKAFVTRCSAVEPLGGSRPIWRAKVEPSV
jgi:hypothetical protein